MSDGHVQTKFNGCVTVAARNGGRCAAARNCRRNAAPLATVPRPGLPAGTRTVLRSAVASFRAAPAFRRFDRPL
jgi:hypothetical protein